MMRRAAATSTGWRYPFSITTFDALQAPTPEKSLEYYYKAEKLLPPEVAEGRVGARLNLDIARPLMRIRDYDKALERVNRALAFSYRHDQPDIRVASLYFKRVIFRDTHNTKGYEDATSHMMALKDSLGATFLIYDMIQLANIKERREMERRVTAAEYREKAVVWALISVSAVCLVIVAFLILLRRKNSEIRRRSLYLIDRMRRMYTASDRPDEQTTEIKGKPAVPATDDSEGCLDAETEGETSDFSSSKYENSNLSEEKKEKIASAISMVMAGHEIYAPDLTLASFSRMTGHHPKAVSQVIHERYGCNFSTFINRARVVEACRRFEMPEYSHLSIEGIAQSVGYASRSTFSANFRKVTGLGIREYRKVAGRTPRNEE